MMSKRQKLLVAVTIAIILSVVGVVAFILYPPAGIGVGVVAAAAVTWVVTKAFDTIADHVAETLPLTDQTPVSTQHHESHIHTHTMIISRDTIDEQGRHITETVTDIIQDDDEPRSNKHKLVN